MWCSLWHMLHWNGNLTFKERMRGCRVPLLEPRQQMGTRLVCLQQVECRSCTRSGNWTKGSWRIFFFFFIGNLLLQQIYSNCMYTFQQLNVNLAKPIFFLSPFAAAAIILHPTIILIKQPKWFHSTTTTTNNNNNNNNNK